MSTSKTLQEIRSDACNTILVTFALLAVPAVGGSVLRSLEMGFRPITALHVVLALILGWAALRRRRLSLLIRASILVAVPYVVVLAGLLAHGRGNGVLMFFVSAIVTAGCFFSPRSALSVVALCVATLTFLFVGDWSGLLSIPVNPAIYDMDALSWMSLVAAFLAASAAPLIGLMALLRSLEAERKRADDAAKARSQFLANMSHELRTPVAGVIGMAEALQATRLNDQQHTLLTRLMLSERNLLAVLNDVLDFARFETGQATIARVTFRISDMVREACAVLEARAAQKGLSLQAEIPATVHDEVTGDKFRVGQVLANLVDNAIKFTPRGSVVICVTQARCRSGALVSTFAVADTGIGIPPGEIERIFDPFVQADMSTSRTHGGAGLGLAICRRFAAALNGRISVTSTPQQGSTFTFDVPLAPAAPGAPACSAGAEDRAAAAVVRLPPQPAAPTEHRPLRLLVADDDVNMRTLADIMFRRHGHEVSIVEDGARAVGAVRAARYDCLILDMHMPVMNGPDAMRAIRQAEEARRGSCRLPIIALTADVMPDHVRGFMDAGADLVVAKPIEWDMLDVKIRELTRARGAGSNLLAG